MGSTSDGQAAAADASGGESGGHQGAASAPVENAGRGFFGRLISALVPGDDSQSATGLEAKEGAALALLSEIRVEDVAVPKAEVVAVSLDISLEDLVSVFREHGFSRLPVYGDSLDSPLGLVLLKDVALRYGFGAEGAFDLHDLLRPVLFAPPSMPAAVLLQKMQKDRAHMALIIDEYGGVDGLVTIEDLIETVIGEIEDEHDEISGHLWKEDAPGVILAQSTADLDDLEKAFGIRLRDGAEDEEIDTLGGLVFLRTGRVPLRGEVVELGNGARIEVIDADVRRIKRLRLLLPRAQS